MTLRDRILNVEDTVTEIVDIPEWGVKVAVKGLTIGEQQQFLKSVRKRTGEKTDFTLDNDKFVIQLLIRTVSDPETGETLFEQADAQTLMSKSWKAMSRIYNVSARLSGFADDDEVQDDLKTMASDDTS